MIGLNLLGEQVYNNLHTLIKKESEKRSIENKKEIRVKLKHFKIEITESFWRKRVKYIQREKPLTEDEVDELLKDK